MSNTKWFSEYPASETVFLELGESDHRPLITYISADRDQPRRIFCYDSRMMDKDGFKESVIRGWRGTGQTSLLQIPLTNRISRCHQQIAVWKRSNKNNAEEQIKVLRGRLDKALCSATSSQTETNMLKEELDKAYIEEEIFWKQKSLVMWLRAGDRNTKYFQAISRTRRIKNTITSIQDETGVVHRGHKNIAKVAENYFNSLFSSQGDISIYFDQVFHGFQETVSASVNEDLTRDITEDEVQQAVFDIGPHRAPGPDGFPAIFYHQHWEEIKPDIMKEIKNVLHCRGV